MASWWRLDSDSERGFLRYFHSLIGHGMLELQAFGMQIQTVGGLSVEWVAYDGTI